MLTVPVGVFTTPNNKLLVVGNGKYEYHDLPIAPFKIVECSETEEGAEFTNLIGGGKTYIRKEEYPYLPTIRRSTKYGDRVEQEIDYVLETVKEHPEVFEKFTYDGYVPYPLIFDIETASSGHFPSADRDQIISIQVKFLDCDEIILVDDTLSQDGEIKLITDFLNLVKESPTGKTPDIMVGFFLNKFDVPYVLKRISVLRRQCKEIGELFDSLSRAPIKGEGRLPLFYPNWIQYGKADKEMIDFVPGLLTLDLYIHAKVDLELAGLPNRKLKTVSKAYGFEAFDIDASDKRTMTEVLLNERDKFMRYATSDVLATEYLYNIYIQRLIAAANMLRCPLSMVHRMSSGQKSYLALYRDCRKNQYHALDRNDKRYEYLYDRAPKYQGALVACYKRGYFPRTVYLDAKCMHKDTELLGSNGYYKVKDAKVGDDIYANNVWQRIAHVEETVRTDAVRITTDKGNSIITSIEHRFPVYIKNRKTGYSNKDYITVSEAGKLKKGDILLECYDYPLYNDNNPVDVKELYMSELLGIFDAEGSMNDALRDRVRYDRNENIQKDIRYTLISFTIHENEIKYRDRILFLIKELTGFEMSIRKVPDKKSVVIQSGSHALYDYMIDKIISRRNSILRDKLHCSVYLRGLITGDGHYNKIRKTLTLTQSTVNNDIIEFTHKCLIRCGIPHKLTGNMKAKNQTGIFSKRMIEIPTKYLYKFSEEIGLIEHKIKLPITWKPSKLQNDIRDGYRLSRIRSIEVYTPEPGEKFYDIMMEDQSYPYFFANNILTHNSLYPNIMHDYMVSYDSYTLEGTTEYSEWADELKKLPNDAMIQAPINKSESDNWPSIVSYGPPTERVILIPDDNYELVLKFKFDLITEGFMRKLIKYYNGERDRYKKLMNKYEKDYKVSNKEEDRIKAMMYNSFQGEAKIINNTFYGVQGNKYYDHADLPAAIFVTAIGRWTMTEMVRMFGKKAIIEIDTDGLLLDRDHFNMEIDDINKKLRQRMNEFFGIPVDKMNFLLEFEGAGSVYMYKRKNYILRKDSSPDKLTTKGSSFKGYDKAKIVQRATAIMAEAVMNQVSPTTYSDACNQARDIYPILATNKDMFCFTKTLKKRPEEYKGFRNNIDMYINAVDHTLPPKELFLEKKKRAFTSIELVMGRENNAGVQRMKQVLRDCKTEENLKQFVTMLQAKHSMKGRSKSSNYLLDLIMKLKHKGREVEVDDILEYYYSLTSDGYTLSEDLKSDSEIDVSRYLADIDSIIERFSYADPRRKALSLMDLMEEDNDEIEEGFEDDSEDDED